MSERIKVVVVPHSGRDGELSISDAMQQVMDTFALVEASGSTDGVVWNLVGASTNSPLTIEGEAKAREPGVNGDLIAISQKRGFNENYRQLRRGIIPPSWGSSKPRAIVENFVRRNLNGISDTEIFLGPNFEVSVSKQDALAIDAVLNPVVEAVPERYLEGSIDGVLVDVGTHYNKPAIQVRERLTGECVWCVVSESKHQRQISGQASFEDVWRASRFRISGRLFYDSKGRLSRVHAEDVVPVSGRRVGLDEIRDPTFTGGLNPKEYIRRLNEGELD